MTARWTLDRYFFRRFVTSFLTTLLVIFAIVYLVNLVEVGRQNRFSSAGLGVTALIAALRVPSIVEEAFPFIALFSALFTLLSLNRTLELVIARAAGISVWQQLAPFVVAAFVLGTLSTLVYNPLSAWAQGKSADMETALAGGSTRGGVVSPWLRQSGEGVESIIGAKAVSDGGLRLGTVTAFVLAPDGSVRERIDAPSAQLGETAWRILDPTVTRIGYAPVRLASFRLPTTLRPEFVEQRLADPRTVPVWDLGDKIEVARSLGYNAAAFSMHYETLLARGGLFAAMVMIAATVGMRFSRTGQSGRTIVGGLAAGFVLYIVTFLAKALGTNSIVPPVAAAWFPVAAAGLFGVTILLHQEDG